MYLVHSFDSMSPLKYRASEERDSSDSSREFISSNASEYFFNSMYIMALFMRAVFFIESAHSIA